jgi:hypothetical protein
MSMDVIGKKEMGEKARREVTYDVIGYEEVSTLCSIYLGSDIMHHASPLGVENGGGRIEDGVG